MRSISSSQVIPRIISIPVILIKSKSCYKVFSMPAISHTCTNIWNLWYKHKKWPSKHCKPGEILYVPSSWYSATTNLDMRLKDKPKSIITFLSWKVFPVPAKILVKIKTYCTRTLQACRTNRMHLTFNGLRLFLTRYRQSCPAFAYDLFFFEVRCIFSWHDLCCYTWNTRHLQVRWVFLMLQDCHCYGHHRLTLSFNFDGLHHLLVP